MPTRLAKALATADRRLDFCVFVGFFARAGTPHLTLARARARQCVLSRFFLQLIELQTLAFPVIISSKPLIASQSYITH